MAAETSASRELPARPAQSPSLVMTDYGLLLAVLLALAIAIDPLQAEWEREVAIKHLPLLLFLPAFLLALVGARVFDWQRPPPATTSLLLPLCLLALLVCAGGLYARLIDEVRNSFLVAGVYMACAPLAAAMLARCRQPLRLLQALALIMSAASLWVFAGLAINYGVQQVYHELEFLFPPLAVLCAFAFPRGARRWAGILFFLLLALLHKKNTGYLAALIVLAWILALEAWPRWRNNDRLRAVAKLEWLLTAGLVLAALIAWLALTRQEFLPSGNPQFRMFTYERAWLRFLESPFWGNAFSAPATELFTVFDTGVSGNVLPTHSDVLDLFSNGGLLGVGLWLWMLLRLARAAWQEVLQPARRALPLAPYGHWLACTSVVGIVTYAFNPIMLQPAKALLLWTTLGLLAGIVALAHGQRLESEAR